MGNSFLRGLESIDAGGGPLISFSSEAALKRKDRGELQISGERCLQTISTSTPTMPVAPDEQRRPSKAPRAMNQTLADKDGTAAEFPSTTGLTTLSGSPTPITYALVNSHQKPDTSLELECATRELQHFFEQVDRAVKETPDRFAVGLLGELSSMGKYLESTGAVPAESVGNTNFGTELALAFDGKGKKNAINGGQPAARFEYLLSDTPLPQMYQEIQFIFEQVSSGALSIFQRRPGAGCLLESNKLDGRQELLKEQPWHFDSKDMAHAAAPPFLSNLVGKAVSCKQKGSSLIDHQIHSYKNMHYSLFMALVYSQTIDIGVVSQNGTLSWVRLLLRVNVPVIICGHVLHRGTEFVSPKGTAGINILHRLFGEVEPTETTRVRLDNTVLMRLDRSSQAWLVQNRQTGKVDGCVSYQPTWKELYVSTWVTLDAAKRKKLVPIEKVNKVTGMKSLIVVVGRGDGTVQCL